MIVRRQSLLRRTLILLAGVLMATVPAAAQDDAPFFQLPESPIEGGKLFMEKGCVNCHAIHGLGGAGGPDLGRVQAAWSFLDIAGVMWNHQPKMEAEFKRRKIARPELTSDEMFQLIAFVYFLNYFGNPGDATDGELVFLRKQCIDCHSVGSQGPSNGIALDRFQSLRSPAFIAAALWNASREMTRTMQEENIQRPVYEPNDIVNILAFIRREADPALRESSVYPPPGSSRRGAVLFEKKGCISCHAVRGEGGDVGPSLGAWQSGGVLSQMASTMWNHGPEMWKSMDEADVEQPEFTEQEMSDIMTYLYFSTFVDPPGDPDRGEKIFSDKGCIACHWGGVGGGNSKGLGATEMHLPNAPSVIAAMWNHAPEMEEAIREVSIAWPRFQPGEMVDLVAFIKSRGEANVEP